MPGWNQDPFELVFFPLQSSRYGTLLNLLIWAIVSVAASTDWANGAERFVRLKANLEQTRR